jgi:general stress protein 26
MTDHAQRTFELMHDMDFCMLVTHGSSGFRARPMSAIVNVEEQIIHMLTDVTSSKDEEIQKNPDILLTFSNGRSLNVALRGKAEVKNDRSLIKQLWNVGAKAFWPQGPDDPSILALEITPLSGEYWEGNNALVGAFKFAAAIATGTQVDAGTNARTAFRGR